MPNLACLNKESLSAFRAVESTLDVEERTAYGRAYITQDMGEWLVVLGSYLDTAKVGAGDTPSAATLDFLNLATERRGSGPC